MKSSERACVKAGSVSEFTLSLKAMSVCSYTGGNVSDFQQPIFGQNCQCYVDNIELHTDSLQPLPGGPNHLRICGPPPPPHPPDNWTPLWRIRLAGFIRNRRLNSDRNGLTAWATVYVLTFAGLNFRGSQILAIFAFILSRMQGLSFLFVYSSFPQNPCRIDVINCFGGGS